MFGSPRDEFPGRGALEALGADIPLDENDVAVLTHFAHVRATETGALRLAQDRVSGTPEAVASLFNAIRHFEQDGITITVTQTAGMFGVLTLRGDVSPHITDSNPMVDGRFLSAVRPLHTHATDPAAIRTAQVLTAYLRRAYHILNAAPLNATRIENGQPPINGLVTQRAGRLRPHMSMRDRYGLRGLSVASGTMYKGLAKYLGMDFHKVDNSDAPGKDYAHRVAFASSMLETHDFIHVHTKTPDQAGHSKNPENKVKVIEALDQGLADSIEPLLANEDVLICVTADHSTPSCGTLIHSGEPVPLMFIGNGVRRDTVRQFDEIQVAGGALGMARGDELMHLILNYLDRARLGGIHDSPLPQEFWPGDHEPFTLE
ncbi:phosphoglycerate mutase [Pseudodesulfovibrio sediminis]|uniref:Phosphoglycerate mutase n=2 Tax=Pseudodesulfovibrio sediminis TaxID=2810563 RepID=A0ABN6EY83_9BACT|nr:phosphoglycerate mutase [Pseudodesulfovibrio sediminis]